MGANATLAPEVAGEPRDLVFVSYSHTDSKWLDWLSTFLKPYIKQGRLKVWNDPYIRVGDRWRREISTALGRTCVGVLLVSPDFIASDFIQDEEVPPLVRGAEMGSLILFAIPISASAFKITPLAHYQWAHDPKQGKACLLVLDDLWRLRDAEPFDVLGPRSRLLTTTRDADLLVALGAGKLPLDVLSEDLALELLASWSGQARQALPPVARQVAESCGYLPLALALAGARIQGGGRWEDVLAALERGHLEFLDHLWQRLQIAANEHRSSADDRLRPLLRSRRISRGCGRSGRGHRHLVAAHRSPRSVSSPRSAAQLRAQVPADPERRW